MSRTWVFQANPKRFDLVQALQDGGRDSFSCNQHRAEIQPGDRVWFRLSGKDAGIYAAGHVTSLPYLEETEFGAWRIGVKFDFTINPPLLRSESRTNPRLEASSALRGRLGTNLPLGDDADALLQELVYDRLEVITKSEYVLGKIESAAKAADWDLFAVQRRAGMGRRRTRIRVDMDALDRELSAAYRLAIRNDPCFYCGKAGEHDDHYHALADGGTDHWWNLVRACEHCNCSKGAKHGDDFLRLREAVPVV